MKINLHYVKKESFYKRILFSLIFLSMAFIANGQVGIGTSSPNPSSQLHIVSDDRGILIPQVALTSTTDTFTITNGNVESLLVYNTNTINDVVRGYYYWAKNKWNKLMASTDNLGGLVDNGNGMFTFSNPDGTEIILNFPDIISQYQTLTELTYDPIEGHLIYQDEEGNDTIIDLVTAIVDNQTVTIMETNPDGTLTYTDENGNTTIVDIPSLVEQYQTLTSLTANPLTGTLTYKDENEVDQVIDMAALIAAHQSVTTLVENGDGTITYTNENNQSVTVNLPSGLDGLSAYEIAANNGFVGSEVEWLNSLQGSDANITLVDGANTTVESVGSGTGTEWKVNVATANATTLGVVKEAGANPTVSVDSQGALSVNLENLYDIKEISGTYQVQFTDAILLGNASSADVTVILPSPVNNKGKTFTIKKYDTNEDYYVNVFGNINGLTQLYTALPHSGWVLVSDGTQWKITSKF
jgi:hypothetical protein